MKRTIAASLLLFSGFASAINVNIGFPQQAERLSISGQVNFIVDCLSRSIDVTSSTNDIFTKFIKKKVNAMCVGDSGTHNVKYVFERGRSDIMDMITNPRINIEKIKAP